MGAIVVFALRLECEKFWKVVPYLVLLHVYHTKPFDPRSVYNATAKRQIKHLCKRGGVRPLCVLK